MSLSGYLKTLISVLERSSQRQLKAELETIYLTFLGIEREINLCGNRQLTYLLPALKRNLANKYRLKAIEVLWQMAALADSQDENADLTPDFPFVTRIGRIGPS